MDCPRAALDEIINLLADSFIRFASAECVDKVSLPTEFNSPTEAVEFCQAKPDPTTALMELVRHSVEVGEFGFAAEMIVAAEMIPELNTATL